MSKRLIHWAKKESFEEDSIKFAAEEVGIDEYMAAEIIDDTLKYYREESSSNLTLPDIYIGKLLSIKPNVHRITRAIKDFIFQAKASLITNLVFDYNTFVLRHVRRRLLNHKHLSKKEKREVSLLWKHNMPSFLKDGLVKRKEIYKEAGHTHYYYSLKNYRQYLKIKRVSNWLDVKRKRLFNKLYRNNNGV